MSPQIGLETLCCCHFRRRTSTFSALIPKYWGWVIFKSWPFRPLSSNFQSGPTKAYTKSKTMHHGIFLHRPNIKQFFAHSSQKYWGWLMIKLWPCWPHSSSFQSNSPKQMCKLNWDVRPQPHRQHLLHTRPKILRLNYVKMTPKMKSFIKFSKR